MPKAAGKDKEMDGVEKAAILLIALGPEKSAQIFKHLKEDEIEQLTLEIAPFFLQLPCLFYFPEKLLPYSKGEPPLPFQVPDFSALLKVPPALGCPASSFLLPLSYSYCRFLLIFGDNFTSYRSL